MEIIQGSAGMPAGCVLALGNFDGVHTAHRKLLETALAAARARCVSFGVYTFRDNTKLSLGVSGFALLTTDSERRAMIEEGGADFLYEEDFQSVRDMSADDFAAYLINTLHVSEVVCGEDFRFGKGASGKPDLLKEYLPAVVVPTLCQDGQAVSSTRIRELIRGGDVERAAALLGYRYFIETSVIHGQSLGHTLGFPTVNQVCYGRKLTPKRGVYHVLVKVGSKRYPGIANVGVRPTVCGGDSDDVVFETHIIGFDGDLYGKIVRVEFCKYLRAEMKFSSVEALKNQVLSDIEETKRYFETK